MLRQEIEREALEANHATAFLDDDAVAEALRGATALVSSGAGSST